MRFAIGAPGLDDFELEIVDAEGAPLPDRREGRILVRGPSVAGTFIGDREIPVREGWLDTGDLGFVVERELFITGRVKDLVIRGGANIHPQQIESAAESVDGVRAGRVAAFSIVDTVAARERIIVVVESSKAVDDESRAALARAVLQALATDDEVDGAGARAVRRRPLGALGIRLSPVLRGHAHLLASGQVVGMVGARNASAPEKGAMNGTRAAVASGSAARLVGVPM